ASGAPWKLSNESGRRRELPRRLPVGVTLRPNDTEADIRPWACIVHRSSWRNSGWRQRASEAGLPRWWHMVRSASAGAPELSDCALPKRNIGVDVTRPGDFFSPRHCAQGAADCGHHPIEVPMPKLLSSSAVEAYRRDGYHFPVPVLSSAEVTHYRACLEMH